MSLWLEDLNELQRYHALRREAEQFRIERKTRARLPKGQKVWPRVMRWLGSRLSVWGKQLQEQYGPTPIDYPSSKKYSDEEPVSM